MSFNGIFNEKKIMKGMEMNFILLDGLTGIRIYPLIIF